MTAAPADSWAEAREALARHDWAGGAALLEHPAIPPAGGSPEIGPPGIGAPVPDRSGAYPLGAADEAAAGVADADRLDLLAEALWWLGRLDDSIEAGQRAYRAHADLGATRKAGMSAVWLYEHHGQRAQPAIASAWLQRARRALDGDTGCVEHGALLLREAELAHGDGRLDDAVAMAERALDLGRSLRSPDLEAEALQTIGRVLIDRGEVARGLAQLDEAMLLAVEGRLGAYSTGKVYCSLIGACEDVGDLRRAAEWTDATTRWAQQHPLAIFPGICRIHHAVVLDRRGELVDAERELSRACTELADSHLANAAAAFAEVGDIRRRLGDLDRAEQAFARAEELSGGTCAGAALLRLAQGRVDAAARIIAGCMAADSPSRLARARLLPAAAQIAVATGDLAAARDAVDELESSAAVYDTPMLHATASLARGRVQLAEHDAVAACVSLRESLRRWQELEVPFEVATTRTVLGQALRASGDEEGAAASFAAARALFDAIGTRLDAPSAGFGAGAGTRTALPDGLTDREGEVLRLVAAGKSNRAIADELHLSIKTVSRHLSNIFTKIDVSSRSAATAYAFEHHLVGRAEP